MPGARFPEPVWPVLRVQRALAARFPLTSTGRPLRAYAQATKPRERLAKPQRDAYDRALDWARMGTTDDFGSCTLRKEKTPPFPAGSRADDGTRTHDLLHGKQTL